MQAKIKIEKIYKKQVDTKFGKKWKYGFKYGDKWFSAFENPAIEAWKEGDVVDIEYEEKEFDGKTYYNIVTKKITLEDIMAKLDRIESLLTPL